MNSSTHLTRLLWVLPEDLLTGTSPSALATVLQDQFSCDTWLLCEGTALAYSIRGILVTSGVSADYQHYLEVTRPMEKFLEDYVPLDADALPLHVPQSKFWIEMLLQPEEKETKSCCYVVSSLNQ